MNTIEHEGKTYEVLTIDRISEANHAVTSVGVVREIQRSEVDGEPHCLIPMNGFVICQDIWEHIGIIPLRLVPKEPVTFEGVAYLGSDSHAYIRLPKDYSGKRFRGVEIVEEAK